MYQDPRQTAKAHKEGEEARETAGKEADISASICVGGDKAHQVSKGWNLWSPGAELRSRNWVSFRWQLGKSLKNREQGSDPV